MIDWKDCVVPIGKGVIQPPPQKPRRKRVPRKCSTCENIKCKSRFAVVEWLHCGAWKGANDANEK